MAAKASFLFVALLLTSVLPLVPMVKAAPGEADVYIIQLSGVGSQWVANSSRVKDGAIDACTVNGPYIQYNLPRGHVKREVDYPPYYEVTPCVISSWADYRFLVEHGEDIVIVNTHGECLPVPYSFSKEEWVDKIAEGMLYRGLTWVHCGGYTFYHIWYEETGYGGVWVEEVNGVNIGGGFRKLMSRINIVDADLLPPTWEKGDCLTTFKTYIDIANSWQYPDGWTFDAKVGRPMKFEQFKEYMYDHFFMWVDPDTNITYLPGGIFTFAKAGERYTSVCVGGMYVHLGVGDFIAGDNALDSDYGLGFIGTAAACRARCNIFPGRIDAKSADALHGGLKDNATICCQPVVLSAGGRSGETYYTVKLAFPLYGATRSDDRDTLHFQEALFFTYDLPSHWSDVTMQVKAEESKEGFGNDQLLSGLYETDPQNDNFGLAVGAICTAAGFVLLSYSCPPASAILGGVGGVRLYGSWAKQVMTSTPHGVLQPEPYIEFRYMPKQEEIAVNGSHYWEFATLAIVELKIPTAGRSGWNILPLRYVIKANPSFYWYYDDPWLEINDTLEIALWFNNAGQSDAGTGRDVEQSDPAVIALPNSYHGYLGGDDYEDWYNLSVDDHRGVKVSVTPPPFVDFDIEAVCDHGIVYYSSQQGTSVADSLTITIDYAETLRLKVYRVSGSGVYTLSTEPWIMGDIRPEGEVNILDAIRLGNAFDLSQGQQGYNPYADLYHDKTVNILDAIILGNHFGEHVEGLDGGGTSGSGDAGALTFNPSVYVSPSALTVFKGEVFSVNVWVSDVTNLYGWEFQLFWSSAVLNCTSVQVYAPSVWVGNTTEYAPGLENVFNATHGRYWKALSAVNPASSFNGSMSVATLTFKALQSGSTGLELAETLLGNSTGEPVGHVASSSAVNVYYGRYMRSDTQTVNGLNAYVLSVSRSASELSYSSSVQGRKTVYWGIRAWIRHSSGSEAEIPLDGVAGTPKAVVSRSSGSGMQAGTAAVSATSLQPTDSLVVRVYMKLGAGSWKQCAAFTSEQLQASQLSAATWTVYYSTYSYYSRVDDMTLGTFYWGTATRDSRIQNLQYN